MTEAKIYVGLNDATIRKQLYETDRYISILKNICVAYHIPFSLSTSRGSCFHEDGEYTEKNTLVLTLIDIDRKTIEEIARDLCSFFHQESAMVTETETKSCFIQDSIE